MTLEEKVGQLMMWMRAARTSRSSTPVSPAPSSTSSARRWAARWTSPRKPPRHPAARRRGRHPRPLVLEGRDQLPDPARTRRELEPRLIEQVGRVTAEEMLPRASTGRSRPCSASRATAPGAAPARRSARPVSDRRVRRRAHRGYQGKGLDDPTAVLATAKHYAGYSETQGGRDASEADISRRKLRSYSCRLRARRPRRRDDLHDGYQSMDGVPSTINRWLLTDVLKTNGASAACS